MNEISNAYDAEGTGEIQLTLHSGARVDLRTLKTFEIEDIAHALSNLCRFAGHVPTFYSVAQHSVFVSHLLPRELQFAGLMHDAGEAYLTDLPHFIKHAPELAGYLELERMIESRLFPFFDLPYPFDPKIKLADRTATEIEWKQFMHDERTSLFDPIVPLCPAAARREFLKRYRELAIEHGQRAITRI